MKRLILISMAAVLLLAACGPEPTPTPDVVGTAMAMALTMGAQTQAAIPTATPVPPTETPTETPPPTSTPVPLPTQPSGSFPTNTPAGSDNSDPCNGPMSNEPTGPKFTAAIKNETKGSANISLWLAKTPFGECGYRGFSVGKNDTITVSLPQGCYYAYAWINDPKNPSTAQGGPLCANNSDKWTFVIRAEIVILNPP